MKPKYLKYFACFVNNIFSRNYSVIVIVVLIFEVLFIGKYSSAQDVMFKATFENSSLEADVGRSFAQTDAHGVLRVVPNPYPDNVNNSVYVLESAIEESSKARAEYSNSARTRYPTDGEIHIYTWKRYYPKDMFKDLNLIWLLVAQWKTWPCEKNGEHGDYICPGGAIFNDVDFKSCKTEKFRFRALPDCNNIFVDVEEGVWEQFTMIIYWSNTKDGYYHLFKNNILQGGETGVKTIYDNFPEDNSCDIYFTLGLYSGWNSPVKDTISYYIDDFVVYKADQKSDFKNIFPECAAQITESSLLDIDIEEEMFWVYPNPCNSQINIRLRNKSQVVIYNTAGKLVYENEHLAGENQIDFNISSGIFFVKVIDFVTNNSSTQKLII